MFQTNLVIYIAVCLQVSGILMQLFAIYAVYRVDHKVIMQVARVQMRCHHHFKIREGFGEDDLLAYHRKTDRTPRPNR